MAEGAGQGADMVDADVGPQVITSLKGSMGERITKALSKVEEKKKKRAIRRAMVNTGVLISSSLRQWVEISPPFLGSNGLTFS